MTKKRKEDSKSSRSTTKEPHVDLPPVNIEISDPENQKLWREFEKVLNVVGDNGDEPKVNTETPVTVKESLTLKQIAQRPFTQKRIAEQKLNKKKILDGVKKIHLEFDNLFAEPNRELKMLFRPHLEDVLADRLRGYDANFEIRMGNPPLEFDMVLAPVRSELDSLVELASRYQGFTEAKPLPDISADNIVLLSSVLLWFRESSSKAENDEALHELHCLEKYLSKLKSLRETKNNTLKITIDDGVQKPFKITTRLAIDRMIYAVEPLVKQMGKKSQSHRHKGIFTLTVNAFKYQILILKNSGITNEFLFDCFQRVNKEETPTDKRAFKRRLNYALK